MQEHKTLNLAKNRNRDIDHLINRKYGLHQQLNLSDHNSNGIKSNLISY